MTYISKNFKFQIKWLNFFLHYTYDIFLQFYIFFLSDFNTIFIRFSSNIIYFIFNSLSRWEQEQMKLNARERQPHASEQRIKKSSVRQIFSKTKTSTSTTQRQRKTSTSSSVVTTKSRFAYDPFEIERKDDDRIDDKSSVVSRVSNQQRPSRRRRPEPADVIAAREELDSILQQQDEIECRKKEINDRLDRQKRQNHGLEETMLRQASNDHHREIIKSLCFLHEYQIRNMELESMALMKEFLLQQKELETQRTDMRRRLVDEVVDLQQNVITGL